MSREGKGTTDSGYENPNGQVVVRNTGERGMTLASMYELRCKHCGDAYGANGSDIHERKCPNVREAAQGSISLISS